MATRLTAAQREVLRRMADGTVDFGEVGAWDLHLLIDAGLVETYERGKKHKFISWRLTPAGRAAVEGE